jgi:hypothetical protein
MLTPREFEREQWAHWKREEKEIRTALRNAWLASSLHPTRRPRLMSLETLLNPPRVVKGREKEKLDREFAEMAAWALSVPVLPLKGGGKELPPWERVRRESDG